MELLSISFGKRRTDKNWKVEHLSWNEFVERLREVRYTHETVAQYEVMSVDEQFEQKDGIAFVGGTIKGGRRQKEAVTSRSLITLDADHIHDEHFLMMVDLVLGGRAYVIYSTHSHRPGHLRYRIIVLPDRAMSLDEYSAVSRKLAEQIGMHYFDKTTFEVNRLMYLPSCSKDAEPVLEICEGDALNVDGVLAGYEDWQDVMQWPRHPEDERHLVTGKKAQDPREKRGPVGLFCRAYTIEEIVDTFLTEAYTAGSMANRYTYTGGTSGNGLELYPDQGLAYSHQDSDPVANGHSHNGFDLVRIHKFRHLDEDIPDSVEIDKKPSHLEMVKLVNGLEEVQFLEQEENDAALQAAFVNEWEESSTDENALSLSGIHTPLGFKFIGGKIFEVKELKNGVKYVPVCDCMVAVIARSESLTDGTQGLDVRWNSGNGTRTVSKPRSTFVDSKKIIDLADCGLPVHSGNARNLATYISRFESANEQNLKTRQVSNQLGWTKGGFLLGDTFIGDGDVRFEPKDGGDAQIAKGFHVKGTMEGTLDVLNKIKPFPMVKMAMYAALSAPLLKKWGESPYIFELAGTTSRGKTTALRIAASLYGCPDESKPGFFKQWNATKVSLERYASIMNHLPLFIDDTKNGDADRVIKPIIYQFASGQGKGRGSLKGMQFSANWQTVMLSTGEQKITSFAKDGGAVARVLSLEGSPFTTADIASARLVQELNKQISEHYGHIAEPWIRFLQTTDMKPWKKKFETVKDGYLQMARGDGEVAMRLSGITALIDVVGEMFDTCFGFNLHSTDELHNEWGTTVSSSTEMDRAQEALDDTLGWVDSRHQQFIKGDYSPYHGVLLGEIKKDKLIIIAVNLNDFLEAHGYPSRAIAKKWRDNGWLITRDDGKKRTQDNPKVRGENKWSYVFDLSKIDWSFDFNAKFSEFDRPE